MSISLQLSIEHCRWAWLPASCMHGTGLVIMTLVALAVGPDRRINTYHGHGRKAIAPRR
jgi:hypothetical protein